MSWYSLGFTALFLGRDVLVSLAGTPPVFRRWSSAAGREVADLPMNSRGSDAGQFISRENAVSPIEDGDSMKYATLFHTPARRRRPGSCRFRHRRRADDLGPGNASGGGRLTSAGLPPSGIAQSTKAESSRFATSGVA